MLNSKHATSLIEPNRTECDYSYSHYTHALAELGQKVSMLCRTEDMLPLSVWCLLPPTTFLNFMLHLNLDTRLTSIFFKGYISIVVRSHVFTSEDEYTLASVVGNTNTCICI